MQMSFGRPQQQFVILSEAKDLNVKRHHNSFVRSEPLLPTLSGCEPPIDCLYFLYFRIPSLILRRASPGPRTSRIL
jgi:hypothetical protein